MNEVLKKESLVAVNAGAKIRQTEAAVGAERTGEKGDPPPRHGRLTSEKSKTTWAIVKAKWRRPRGQSPSARPGRDGHQARRRVTLPHTGNTELTSRRQGEHKRVMAGFDDHPRPFGEQ